MPERVTFRTATRDDLEAVVRLLGEIRRSDDELGFETAKASISSTPFEQYADRFGEIVADMNSEIVIGVQGDDVVATLHLSVIPTLLAKRAIVEYVRVAARLRRRGIGKRLMADAMERARARGCDVLQLTTNVWRRDAIDFYLSLGFEHTHAGLRARVSAAPRSCGGS